MKKTLKQYNIEDPVYEAHLSLFVGNREMFNKKLDKLDMSEVHATGNAKYIIDYDNGYNIIWVPRLDSMYAISKLVHELHHLAVGVFERKGIPISAENDEAMAYYKAMVFNNITKKLKLKVK